MIASLKCVRARVIWPRVGFIIPAVMPREGGAIVWRGSCGAEKEVMKCHYHDAI